MSALRMALLFLLLLSGIQIPAAQAATSGEVERDHVRVALVSEVDSVRPGQPFRVGLSILHDPAWHTYWRNPGDSGLETRLNWRLPDGTQAGAIQWPWPERLPIEHLVNYGYSGELLLPVEIQPPDTLATDKLRLAVRADWLVCKIECIPGSAELTLELPVHDAPPAVAPEAARFAAADARIPRHVAWPARFSTDGGQLAVQVSNVGDLDGADLDPAGLQFFAAEPMLVEHAAEPVTLGLNDTLRFTQALSPYFSRAPETLDVVLVDPEGRRGWHFSATPGTFETAAPSGGVTDSNPGLALILLMALAGGVLLNLMPCVFPVLSLKAMSVVAAGTAQRGHAMAYTAGVLVSFAVLAALLLALRAAGEAIGWGFQLQSPWFIGLLIYVLFGLALSLSGLFEFGGGWSGAGQRLSERGGFSGSFFTGVLAVLVASPCTAPFLGTALGLAVLLPAWQALAVFLALGLGLALPLSLIGLIPALGRALPRPGPWMESFRQVMAFPLYLTVVWLLWVLARQTGADGVAAVLFGMVILAFGLWLIGRGGGRGVLEQLRHVTVAVALIAALGAVAAANRFGAAPENPEDTWWEPWSLERLSEVNADPGRAAFVNMTADWCVTCLVNEGVALNTDAVRDGFRDAGVVYLKGDWTRRDPAITRYLEEFGRNGVPLYVVYPAGGGDPRVLPQVLTPAIVLDAVNASGP